MPHIIPISSCFKEDATYYTNFQLFCDALGLK